jgi:hypothetical protein
VAYLGRPHGPRNRHRDAGGAASKAGDLAWTHGDARWTGGRGRHVRIWRRRGGAWKLVFDQILAVPQS